MIVRKYLRNLKFLPGTKANLMWAAEFLLLLRAIPYFEMIRVNFKGEKRKIILRIGCVVSSKLHFLGTNHL